MHVVQLKPMIKAKISERKASIGISDVRFSILGENLSEEVDVDYE